MAQATKEGCCPWSPWMKVALFSLLLNLLLILNLGLIWSYYTQETELQPELRVMLLGRNGTAKRILGNALLGRKAFPLKPDIAIIHQCKGANGHFLGKRNITIFDSLEIQNTEDMAQRLNICVNWVAPAPHLFLYVTEPGGPVCEEISFVQRCLDRVVLMFTIIVFTGVDRQEEKRVAENIPLTLMKCFNGSHHIFGRDVNKNPDQIRALLEKIDTLMGYKYTKDIGGRVKL